MSLLPSKVLMSGKALHCTREETAQSFSSPGFVMQVQEHRPHWTRTDFSSARLGGDDGNVGRVSFGRGRLTELGGNRTGIIGTIRLYGLIVFRPFCVKCMCSMLVASSSMLVTSKRG